jgi:hypothetical protein
VAGQAGEAGGVASLGGSFGSFGYGLWGDGGYGHRVGSCAATPPVACVTMGKLAFDFRRVYPSPLNLMVSRRSVGSLRQRLGGLPGEVMHDPAIELGKEEPRIHLPRTPVE